MNGRFKGWLAALFSVALVSGVLVVTANAHIGATHSPIDTELPDLVSAEVTDSDEVEYCFDDEVNDFTDAADFSVSGYNAGTVADGDDADLSDDADECIVVQFDIERDVDNFTIAITDEGAAETRGGDESPAGAVALEGSTAEGGEGRTVAPNLTEWEADSDEIDYTFDELVDCDTVEAGDAAAFGYYDEDGLKGEGNDVTDCDDDTVTVEFTDADEDVDDAVRVWVDENQGAADDVCEPSPISGTTTGCTSIEADGDETDDNPDLVDAERTDDDEWTFTFNDDLEDGTCTSTQFHVYQEDGSEFDGSDCSEDDDTVEVQFDTVPDDALDEEIPLAAVEDSAVDDTDSDPNTIGSAPVGDSGEEEGFTDAPDLEEVEEAGDELVDFIFDEDVDDDVDPDEGDFFLVFEDGDTTSGNDLDDVEGNVVTIEFDSDDVADAIGGFVEDDAVEDFNGDLSEPAMAGIGTASTSTSTTTTSGGTGSPTGPSTPKTVKVGSTVTIKYDATPKKKAAFKGAVKANYQRCRRGRTVELHRKGTGIVGRDKTNDEGKWKVPYKNAKGGFFAEVLKKVYEADNGDTVICKKDDSRD